MPSSIHAFLSSVKGQKLLECVFSRRLQAVPAWADPHRDWRLKMALPKAKALRSPEELREKCRDRPGVIVLLGPGTIVLDLDRKNGNDAVRWFERRWGRLADATPVHTPSGGVHLWFSVPRKHFFPTRANVLAPGVDVMGTRGSAPLPGSFSQRGGYVLQGPRLNILPLPGALVDELHSEPRRSRTSKPLCEARTTSRRGYQSLMRYSSSIRGCTYPEQELNRAAFMAGQRCEEIAFSDVTLLVDAAVLEGATHHEAMAVARAAYTAGRHNPRRPS